MKLGIWKNNRHGTEYLVRGTAVDCTNERDGIVVVVYHKYNDYQNVKYFVRDAEEFKTKFTFIREY